METPKDPKGYIFVNRNTIKYSICDLPGTHWIFRVGKPITWGALGGERKTSLTTQLAPGLETRPPQRGSHQRPCRTHSPVIRVCFLHFAPKDWFFCEDYPSESGSISCLSYKICSSSTHLSIQYLSPAPSPVPVA